MHPYRDTIVKEDIPPMVMSDEEWDEKIHKSKGLIHDLGEATIAILIYFLCHITALMIVMSV